MRAEADALVAELDDIGAVIRECALESEQLGRLASPVVEELHRSELFRVLVPAALGGRDFTIPESVAIFERVSSYDAATGWTLAILADGPLFARRLSPAAFETIYGDPLGLMVGSLNPVTIRAERIDGGYRFSGRATYLSGSAHANWVMATGLVVSGGSTGDGIPGLRAGVFPLDSSRLLDTWSVTGMRATGSNDLEFDDVEVADEWTFDPLAPPPPDADDPFALIPLPSQLGGGIAASAVGAARNTIDRFAELAAAKVPAGNLSRLAERAPAQVAVGEAEGLYQAARAVLLQSVESVWHQAGGGGPLTDVDLARQRVGLVTAVRLAARSVDLLHDAAGMSAVADDSVLERCWRDVHTITQHTILGPARFEIAGRALLGIDPGSPFI